MSGCRTWKVVGLNEASLNEAKIEGKKAKLFSNNLKLRRKVWVEDVNFPLLGIRTGSSIKTYEKVDLHSLNMLMIRKPNRLGTGLLIAAIGVIVGGVSLINRCYPLGCDYGLSE